MGDVENKVKELAENTVAETPYEVVDARMSGGKVPALQIFIDKPGGVNVDDCAVVSRKLEKVLDENDVIKGSYKLEVSSPGIERPLVKSKDYLKYVGSKAKVKTKYKIENQKNFVGTIVGADDEQVTLSIDGQTKTLSYRDIDRANLVVDF